MIIVALIGLILGLFGVENMPKFSFDQEWISITSLPKVFGQLFKKENFISVLANPNECI